MFFLGNTSEKTRSSYIQGLDQCFPNLSWRTPSPAHFVCLPYLTHLIQLISSLVETARHDLGVSDKGEIQNVQGYGSSRTGLGSTGLDFDMSIIHPQQ